MGDGHLRFSTAAEFEELAKRQLRLYDEKAPQWRTGGKLIIARLARDRMTIETVCELPAAPAITSPAARLNPGAGTSR
jgi:hypothetical protein